MSNKIIVTDKVIEKALSSNASVNDILYKEYEGEIIDRRKSNSAFDKMTPIKMAMFDAGISGTSIIKDFTTAGAGDWLLPAFIDTRLRESIGGSDMLSYVVNSTVGVDGLSVVAASLDLVNDETNKKNIMKSRVAEGADLPLAVIKLGEQALAMYKHGRAVQATYEALQYMRVDLFSKTIDAIANDVAKQQLGNAINVLVNGDGNNNRAAEIETAAADTITYDDILNVMTTFMDKSGLPITTVIAGKKFFDQIFKMTFDADKMAGADYRFAISTPQFSAQNVNLIYDNRVPQSGGKDIAIFLNSDMALVKYVANGSNIREMANNIRNQTRLGTISEISAFSKFNKDAVLCLKSGT